MSADTAQFDIYDSAGVEFDRSFGIPIVIDAFIQAESSSNLRLQTRMGENIVPREWLLDHQQAECVELLEMSCVIEGVRRVRVHR